MKRIVPIAKRLGLYLAVAVLGFAVGVAALYILWVRSGPPLEVWHTEHLTAEFTAERAEEVRTFDDYRRLEDELFAQLDERVYARTGTGPAHALARYSAGSAADPRRRKPNWNRSFELRADPPAGGVLLLHGMSDGPYSLRALGSPSGRRLRPRRAGRWRLLGAGEPGADLSGHRRHPGRGPHQVAGAPGRPARPGEAGLDLDSRRKAAMSAQVSTEPLGRAWPRGVISLSHVALPFPPDDPLYGRHPPENKERLFLGQMAIQGERGPLRFSSDWLLRLRHNPFYDVLESRTLAWVGGAGGETQPCRERQSATSGGRFQRR